MARTTKERLDQMDRSRRRNEERVRAFVETEAYRLGDGDDREWMIEHFESRLAELMGKGAHRTRPDITERYESDLAQLYKGYRVTQ